MSAVLSANILASYYKRRDTCWYASAEHFFLDLGFIRARVWYDGLGLLLPLFSLFSNTMQNFCVPDLVHYAQTFEPSIAFFPDSTN
jgi:hypothetical protein